jgi:hypothetical protein
VFGPMVFGQLSYSHQLPTIVPSFASSFALSFASSFALR